jgi:C1A family cysteine protease
MAIHNYKLIFLSLLTLFSFVCPYSFFPSTHSENEMINQFQLFIKTHQKKYSDMEFSLRYENYKTSFVRVAEKNEKAKRMGSKIIYGLNAYSDMSPEEFNLKMKGYTPGSRRNHTLKFKPSFDFNAPDSFDWREQNAISPVKNQGQCGSCWAFSTVETVESATYIKTKEMPILSPQQLVDCDDSDSGCNGGLPSRAFDFVQSNGLTTESQYPYEAEDGSCQVNEGEYRIVSSGDCSNDEYQMQEAMQQYGPLSVCVDASDWQDYSGGIFDGDCSNQIDHAVQAVGWGSDESGTYWIIRNSWGTSWGENGFIRIPFGQNACSIANDAYYVVV